MAEARFQLWGSIIMTLHPNGGFGGGYGGVSPYKDFDMPRITVAGRNYTVRQLLNRIVINEGNALWMTRIRPPQMMMDDPFYIVDLGYPNQNGFDWIFRGLDTHFSS